MGNKSSINVPSHFKGELEKCDEPVGIFLHLPNPVPSKSGKTFGQVFILLTKEEIVCYGNIPREYKDVRRIEWKPKTHMRDTQKLYPLLLENENEEKSITIKRGEGIGIIVCEHLNWYAKLVYKKGEKMGVSIVELREWERSEKDFDALEGDLVMGYDVLVIKKDSNFNLCEEEDDRDMNGTVALTPYSKRYPVEDYDQ